MSLAQKAGPRRHKMSRLQAREARTGLLFVLPWLVGLILFTAYPLLATLFLAFTDYSVLEPPRWVGLLPAARWAWPSGAIRSACSCPVIASWAARAS